MSQHALSFLAGFVLRVVEVLVESSLYLLIGFLTAGALRVLAGPERVRALFGTGRWTAPLRAWLAATALLPACSLGVLPVLRELRRAGVPRHATLTFALAAPMLNPISLLGGISYLGPNLLASLVLGTFVVSVGAGMLVGPAREEAEGEMASPGHGSRKLAATLVLAARTATGPAWGDIGAGLLGAGAMAALLSPSDLAGSMFAGDPWANPRMAAIAPLTYATPEKGVASIPEMIKFRQSAGATFVLVALGVGMTLGHARWASRAYGVGPAAAWLGAAMGLTLAVAFAVDRATPPVGTANVDNDHFNEFANPFREASGVPQLPSALARFARDVEPARWFTCGALGTLIAAGLALRALGERGRHETYLAPRAAARATSDAPIWDRPVSPRAVSVAGGLALTAFAGVGLYAFFPSPGETFRDLGIIKADFFGELSSPTLDPALHHLALWERQVAKLRVGSMIRLGPASGEAARRTEDLQEALRSLRGHIESGRRDEARAFGHKVAKIQEGCRQAYLVP